MFKTRTVGERLVLTSKQVFFIFLNIENYSASYQNFRQQVKVSKDEENFAILFIIALHHLLVCQQVIIVLSTGCLLHSAWLYGVVGLEIAVAQIEDIIVDLDDEHGEVDFCELVV